MYMHGQWKHLSVVYLFVDAPVLSQLKFNVIYQASRMFMMNALTISVYFKKSLSF